ncbi:MAG: tRNA pseudouridine synthase B [candidate division WS6 bacterium GW2011_GWA2_37_6]|uniref:tRNA pseudouridine synthase B n=1 Tax=candidate division WS6 bacterium GW2011_GWA2_37_6 TaxID=1619087 RepID=A0A0G0GTP9_9BACT|nr:MAG: tRNA pseudouridine synthase B [candidate division WS6 bacterium GW2011_GWA2_37_6]
MIFVLVHSKFNTRIYSIFMKIIEENSFKINQIEQDEFNRTSAVLAIYKPKDWTSHDIVNQVRKKLRTRKVGHAGALDPFATGVLIVLVGNYTKSSDLFLNTGKEYRCKVLFGVSTNTQDPEGKILKVANKVTNVEIDKPMLEKVLQTFRKGYMQRVPVFSSVKVNGQKLRVIARQAESFEVEEHDNVKFMFKNGKERVIKLPRKKVEFRRLELVKLEKVEIKDLPESLMSAELIVGCSKGTYIRQLAEDIGAAFGLPAMLTELERTKVGEIGLDDCISIEELTQL